MGKKKDKAERKALKRREAELEAAIAAKSAKKGKGKKGKAEKPAKPAKTVGHVALATEGASPEDVLKAAKAVLDDPNATPGAREKAKAAKKRAKAELEARAESATPADADSPSNDADTARRVKAKRLLRAEGIDVEGDVTPDMIDLDKPDVVLAYNLLFGTPAGAPLTSNRAAKLDATAKGIADDYNAVNDARAKAKAEEQPTKRKVAKPKPEVVEAETEHGREFVAGEGDALDADEVEAHAALDEEFGDPSKAEPQLEEGRNGYKIMMLGKDGKPDPKTVRQYTRVTTFIDNLEDKHNLESWKLRTLLEGVAVNDTAPNEQRHLPELAVAKIADLMHARDVALAKARKADRKGKLEPGELGDLEYAANKAFKDAADALADDLLELGGIHEKANRGTNLHALFEVYDRDGMVPINEALKAGTITPADHADVVAYAEALIAADIKVLESEVVVVHDELKRAGRLDRIVLAKLPGAKRATKMLADIKSGRIDYGQGKIAQQLEAYAVSKRYDLATGERSPLGVSTTKALLIHAPAGKAKVSVYPVDLVKGREGNKLSAAVREWRRTSRKDAIDLTVDLTLPEGATAAVATDVDAEGGDDE